jgi:hypothetical protein
MPINPQHFYSLIFFVYIDADNYENFSEHIHTVCVHMLVCADVHGCIYILCICVFFNNVLSVVSCPELKNINLKYLQIKHKEKYLNSVHPVVYYIQYVQNESILYQCSG